MGTTEIETTEIDWKKIVELFNATKYIYALCEETDESLATNLQPLNEFRAALDHLMRIVAIEKLQEYKKRSAHSESEKLIGHLRRAYFDVCDLLAINYRQKITKLLKRYSSDCIESALPDYYPKIKPRLEQLTNTIADLRTGRRVSSNNNEDAVETYANVIRELKEYYDVILSAIPSLNELKNKNFIHKWGLPLIALIANSILAIIQIFLS